MKVLKLSQT
ncbi:Protein of unknown function [Bacillus toyonensis]|nr:Protein of unknown function [Bacillus toyonensis]